MGTLWFYNSPWTVWISPPSSRPTKWPSPATSSSIVHRVLFYWWHSSSHQWALIIHLLFNNRRRDAEEDFIINFTGSLESFKNGLFVVDWIILYRRRRAENSEHKYSNFIPLKSPPQHCWQESDLSWDLVPSDTRDLLLRKSFSHVGRPMYKSVYVVPQCNWIMGLVGALVFYLFIVVTIRLRPPT